MTDIFHYEFMRNALFTATLVAALGGVTGFFLIQRGMTFAGHALPGMGFAGAAGAVWLGFSPLAGLVVFTLAGAGGIARLKGDPRERDLHIGMLLVTALALGLLFLSLYPGFAEPAYAILFGSLLGISASETVFVAGGSLVLGLFFVFTFRPLLFASFDPQAAQARGVPTRLLGAAFMAVTALVVALCVPITGTLLVFTLLVAPAAIATRLTGSPVKAVLLSLLLAEVLVWTAFILAYNFNSIPGFFVAALSFLLYLVVRLTPRPSRKARRRSS